jgi:Ca2+/Na+ antiporter
MKNYQVMVFNAIILIALGIYGYTIPPHSPTSFISVIVGIILLFISFPLKRENSLAAHIGVALTGMTMLSFFIVGFVRMNFIIILMAVVTLLAFLFYISDFFKRRAERERNSNTN